MRRGPLVLALSVLAKQLQQIRLVPTTGGGRYTNVRRVMTMSCALTRGSSGKIYCKVIVLAFLGTRN